MIKVLIVEDSLLTQEVLAYILSSDPIFKIVGFANNGEEAIQMVKKEKPDVIAMDWQMPKLNGKEATRLIMETNPTPIIIVTGSMAKNSQEISFSLMEAGALAIVKKPHAINHPDYKKDANQLIQTLKLMSEVKLIRRIASPKTTILPKQPIINKIKNQSSKIQLVVMGASTGGPQVLQKILSAIPKNFSAPIMIVQHISQGFTKGFVEWLSTTSNIPLHIATQGEYILPGHGYIAPDNFHMGVERSLRIILSNHAPENGLKPSVSYLFRTAANAFGSSTAGVILTGMGQDGAQELKLMKDNGAITFAQDKESSVVHGMPGEAIKLDAATYILSPEEITMALASLVTK